MTTDLRVQRPAILRIAAIHGARNPRVIGSAARGEARPESDLDLLVDMAPDRSLLGLVGLGQDLEDLLGPHTTDDAISTSVRDGCTYGDNCQKPPRVTHSQFTGGHN